MTPSTNKLTAFLQNAKVRVLVICCVSAAGATGAFFVWRNHVAVTAFDSQSEVQSAPSVDSIPGAGTPTAEYVKTQNIQNGLLVTQAKNEGSSAVPTLTRPSFVGSMQDFESGGAAGAGLACDANNPTCALGSAMAGHCSLVDLQQAREAGVQASELRCRGCACPALKGVGFTAGELRFAGYDARTLVQCGYDLAALKGAGFSASDLKAAGYSADLLKAAGFSAGELRSAGFSANDLRAAGFTPAELKAAGFSAKELKAAGFTAAQLKAAGFAGKDLLSAGFKAQDLQQAGFTPEQIAAAMALKNQDEMASVAALKAARSNGTSAASLRDSGFGAAALKAAGFTPRELKAAGFSAADFKAAGLDAKDLKDAGFSAAALKEAGFSAGQLKAAGLDAQALKDAGFDAKALREAGFSADDLKNAGFAPADLQAAGFTKGDLVRAGFTPSEAGYAETESAAVAAAEKARQAAAAEAAALAAERARLVAVENAMKNAGVTGTTPVVDKARVDAVKAALAKGAAQGQSNADIAKQLKAQGFSASELKAAGLSASDLKKAGFTAAQLKAAGFTAEQLRAAGFSPDELKAAGFDAKALRAAGFMADELQKAGFTPAEISAADLANAADNVNKAGAAGAVFGVDGKLIDAGLTKAIALKNAGFTAGQLKALGFTPDQLKAVGFSPAEIINGMAGRVYTDAANVPPYGAADATGAGNSTAGINGEINAQARIPSINEDPMAARLRRIQEEQQARLSAAQRQDMILQSQAQMQAMATELMTGWSGSATQNVLRAPEVVDVNAAQNGSASDADQGPIVKAGTIMFAVLDTGINSDEDTPILAHIITGQLKGAQLLGRFERADKHVKLSFSLLSAPWSPSSISLNALAIDQDTARTAVSGQVDNHYLLRYGSLFASAFLSGMSDAIMNNGYKLSMAGGIPIFQKDPLKTGQQVMVGLGNVGTQYASTMSGNINRAPTITIRGGTGIGILLMSDLHLPMAASSAVDNANNSSK